jgi:hypothetical protein
MTAPNDRASVLLALAALFPGSVLIVDPSQLAAAIDGETRRAVPSGRQEAQDFTEAELRPARRLVAPQCAQGSAL